MLIKSVRIQNLRAYKDETIEFEPYTCLVGANGAGKSTILCALNIFFRESENSTTNLSNLDKEDFHKGNTEEPIEITVTFGGLSDAAKADLDEYHRQEVLVVTAKAQFNSATGVAAVKQYGNRLGMADFAPYFRLLGDGAKVSELQATYASLKAIYPDLPALKVKDAMTEALRAYEAERPEACELIPSEDQFYGVTQGQGHLRKYIQWVYVPAVKDAAGEQAESKNTALGRLLARTVRSQVNFAEKLTKLRADAEEKYQSMLAAEQGALDQISEALKQRLTEWSHPEATAKLLWHQDPKTSVRIEEPMARLLAGDGEFEGSISRFGHGLQRSYIIALLQGLASLNDDEGPRLILGCEEPELYQHPPQARHLATVLKTLSEKNSQIIVSTHSPYFVDGSGFERVRVVRKLRDDARAIVRSCSIADLGDRYAEVTGDAPVAPAGVMARLHQVMQPHLSEMFFTSKLILVEGLEDAAYINAWLVLTEKWDVFRSCGAHIIPVNGKSELIRPAIIAAKMEIPCFVIFDCDGDKLAHKNQDTEKAIRLAHERDNKALFTLCGRAGHEPFPSETIWGDAFAAWPDDLAKCVRADAGEQWEAAGSSASVAFGGVGGLQKNTLHIGARLKELRDLGGKTATLDRLCDAIVDFARKA